MEKREACSKWNEGRSERIGGKSGKTGRLLQVEEKGKQACWGKEWKNGKFAPSETRGEASGVGKRVEKPEDYSKWNRKRSKRVGVNSIKIKNLLKNKEKYEKRG